MKKWFQYVDKLFKIKELGIHHRSTEYNKKLVKIDKILIEFFNTYEPGSSRFYGSKFVIDFLDFEEARELQTFLLNEVPEAESYDVLVGNEDYLSENNLSYLMIRRKDNNESVIFN